MCCWAGCGGKGEGAIDLGGCTNEMFNQLFAEVFSPQSPYFEKEEGKADAPGADGGSGNMDSYLPKPGADRDDLTAIGKLLMKSLLEEDISMPHCVPPSFFDFLTDPNFAVPSDVYQALDALAFFSAPQARGLTCMLDKKQHLGQPVDLLFPADSSYEGGLADGTLLTDRNIAGCIRRQVVFETSGVSTVEM